MKIESSAVIEAPLSKVFEIFTDLEKITERIPGIESLELLEGPAKMAVGTKWKETRVVFGKEATEIMWVTEFTKSKHYQVCAESHGTKYTSNYLFNEVDGATEVIWSFEGLPQTLMAKMMSVIGYLFKGATKKLLEEDLVALKKACEQ